MLIFLILKSRALTSSDQQNQGKLRNLRKVEPVNVLPAGLD